MQYLPSAEQFLEMAVDLFNGKVNKSDRNKALSLLSRAIEEDPSSVVLWVFYLHIFYRGEKCIGKDDMFLVAVQENKGSYELWLMYINSRIQLADRLNAYDNALITFCQRKSICDKERRYTSECILDIFLQMLDFLCMSGNVDKAIWRMNELIPAINLENSSDSLLSDVCSCLTVPDKCIFWFCCVYLVIYRKLPQQIVQQFELEKDMPIGTEWSAAQLSTDSKDRALELMKVAVDDVALDIDVDSHISDQIALRSLHFLAVSHIRCVAALEGFHCSADLLVKYLTLYPTCIELVLISARLQENSGEDVVLQGFEETIRNWPTGTPGLQRIWNQYIEHALVNQGFDCAEKLVAHWLQGFCKFELPSRENLDSREDDSCSFSEFVSYVKSEGGSHSLSEDDTFGLLNLFLERMLQKNLEDARLVIDKALKSASPENYKHCSREHAVFILCNEPDSQNISDGVICRLLHSYMKDPSYSPILEPLSRKYYQNIKKPRLRRLIDNTLGPVSRDFSLMNSVLEACYGPSLLPKKFGGPKDFVDFIESLMEITPANYELALSVYRFTTFKFNHTGIASNAIQLWASSVLVNSIFQAVPVAPENVWLEVAGVLRNSGNMVDISIRFHQQAISVYPFSFKLWQSYLNLSGNSNEVVKDARERGFEI